MAYPRKFLSDTHSSTNPPPSPLADPPSSITTEETDFVIILAALLCALICVVGLMAVARCAWLRRGISSSVGRENRTANKALKKKVLNSLPKYTYTCEINTVVADDCAICLSEYVEGEEIRVLPHCGHIFHVECIDTWLGSHSSCPSCRRILVVARCRRCGEIPAVGSAVAGFGKPSQDSLASSSSSSPTFLA